MMLCAAMSPIMKDLEAVRARIELLLAFKATLAEWHAKTEQLDEENLLFAAVEAPQVPGPEIVAARTMISRNVVAARQAVVDAGVYGTVSGTLGEGSFQNIDPFENIFTLPPGTSLVPDLLDMLDRAIGVYEQASPVPALVNVAAPTTPDLANVKLTADEQFALDRVVEYQFEHAEPTPLGHILVARPVDQADAIRAAIASIAAKRCVEVQGYAPSEFVHLTPTGLLVSKSGGDVARLSEALLAYLKARLASESVRFTHYTWEELRVAHVVTLDAELPRVATVIRVLDFDRSRVDTSPSNALWEVPKDIVDMRALTNIHGLRARADRRTAERRVPGGASQQPGPLDELATLSKRLEAAAHQPDGGALKRLGDEVLAERQAKLDDVQRELSKLKADLDARDERIAELQATVSPRPAESPEGALEEARQQREHQQAVERQVLAQKHERELELLRAQSAIDTAKIKAEADRAVARETARDEAQGKNQRSTAKIGLAGAAIGAVVTALGVVTVATLKPSVTQPSPMTSAATPTGAPIVLSLNQQGGQTAHTINNNAPMPRRVLGRTVDAATAQRLMARPVRGLSIDARSLDAETKDLASDFWNMAVQLKWEVSSRPNMVMSPDVTGRGVTVESTAAATDAEDPLRALADWLGTQGINAAYRPGAPRNVIGVGPQ